MNKSKGYIRELLDYAGDTKSSLYLSVALAVIGELFGMVPYVMAILIINVILGANASAAPIVLYALIAVAAMLLRALFTHRSSVRAHMGAFSTLKNIRVRIADKMMRVPLGVMIDTPSGTYKNLMVDTVSKLEDGLAHYLPEIVSCVVAPLFSIVFIFALDWRMGLASLVSLPLGLLLSSGMVRDSKGRMQIYNRALLRMNDAAVEYVNGIEVIKTFNRGDDSYRNFSTAVKEFHKSTMDWWRRSWGYAAAAGAVMPSTFIGTVPVGGYLLMTGQIEMYAFVACMVLPIGFIGSLMRITTYSQQFAFIGASLDKIRSFLGTQEQTRPEQYVEIPNSTYTFQNVRFGYGDDREILKGISFQTEPGTVTALVGPSGGGKSTIAKLMAGLWDPSSGSVLLGGVDLRDIPVEQLMENVSYVAQDVFLFDKSIRENIRMGNPNATDVDVEAAARAANCHEFILSLPGGYEATAGSAGNRLSGGERQRITIARAMLKRAPIVILDEATSFADPESEAQIQSAIGRLVAGKTLIVVAHRLSTVRNAHQILVIRDGQIELAGKHELLLAKSSTYATMWREYQSVTGKGA